MSASDIRNKIVAADDRTEVLMEIPEWGVTLLLISPTTKVRTQMILDFTETRIDPATGAPVTDEDGAVDTVLNATRMMPSLLVACVCDPETRERVFTDAGDLDVIDTKNGEIVERIGVKCLEITGLSKQAVDAGKGDFSTTLADDSSSGLLATSAAP